MTLICSSCNREMGPSEELPGREGVLVYPIVLSLVYKPDSDGYEITYMKAPISHSLDFRCIADALPPDRYNKLVSVYDAYRAEMTYRQVNEEQKGRWLDTNDLKMSVSAYEKFENLMKRLNPKSCLICDKNIDSGKPYFMAFMIDKICTPKNPLGNYSLFMVEECKTGFGLCFDDFRERFQKTFKQLSYDMLGKKNPEFIKTPIELEISPEIEEQFGSGELDKFLEGLKSEGKIKIIRKGHKDIN